MSRVVLVTGGSRGIGLACAERFKALGDRVAVTYNSSAAPDGLFGVKCDVTSADDVESAFAAVEAEFGGPVEVLVSNAGITRDGLLLRMSETDFSDVVDANLTGAYRVAKRAAQGMLRARKGRMVFVSSVVALLGSAGQANYAASKGAIIAFTKALAKELGTRGVRVNAVAPGYIETELTGVLSDEIREFLRSNTPLGRLGTPEDVATAVRFLCSDEASFVTGEIFLVDGGLGM